MCDKQTCLSSVHPFRSRSHFRAVCALILRVSAPPPPPLAQRAPEDVHPLVPTSHSPPPFRAYQGGQRDNPCPPSPPGLRPHRSRPSPSHSEGGGGWESPLPGSPRPARVPLPLAQGGLPRSPPLPPVHASRRAFPPHLAPTRREGWTRGRARDERRSNHHNKRWGGTPSPTWQQRSAQPRPGQCTRTEGQGCGEGFGGSRRAMTAPPRVHRG